MDRPKKPEVLSHEPLAFYDRRLETKKSEGSFLPHWQQGNAMVFVTFRLADSLPQIKLQALTRAKEEWLRAHPEPHDEALKKEFYRLFPTKLHKWLDAGYGSMILRIPELKDLVENVIRHFDGVRYHLDEFVVAPNHVHALLSPMAGFELSGIFPSWKSFSARKILSYFREKELPEQNPVWQQECWDHLVRSEASLTKFRQYIAEHRR